LCLDEHHSADDSDGEAEQHGRIIPNIGGGTEERRDLSGRCIVGAIAASRTTVRTSPVDAGASSAGGASLVAACTARDNRDTWRGGKCCRERANL
jgi:hypothetical protein